MSEQSTHAGRNIAVVAGAAIVVVVGFLVFKYSQSPAPSIENPQTQAPQPVTQDQKEQILQTSSGLQSTSTPASSAAAVSQHARILQGSQQQDVAPAPPPPSAQEKMKLLQGGSK